MQVKTILFPVDDSVHPRKAIDAIAMFHTINPELKTLIVHVVEPVNALIGSPEREKLNAELAKAGEKLVAPFKAELDRLGIKSTVIIRHGDPAAEIIALALEEYCDMIVMSPRGEGESGFKELLLGSVSQKVLQHSPVPVFLSR